MQPSRFWIIVACLLFFSVVLSAQENKRQLFVGDKLSFDSLVAFSNFLANKPTMSDGKEEIVILDLWSIHCPSCISGIIKLDSLQKVFHDKIKVIFITKHSKEEITRVFSKLKLEIPKLPFIVSDTIFYDKVFPHDGDPVHVWLNKDGFISYISYGFNTTIANVQKVLDGKKLDIGIVGKLENFDPAKSLLYEAGDRLFTHVKYISLLMGGIYELVSDERLEIKKDEITKLPYHIKTINTSILKLYQTAFIKELYGFEVSPLTLRNLDRICLSSANAQSLLYIPENDDPDSWRKRNLYCYELIAHVDKTDGFYTFMKDDLQRYFGFTARLKKKRVKCLVLTKFKDKTYTGLSNDRDTVDSFSSFFIDLFYKTRRFEMPLLDHVKNKSNVAIRLPERIDGLDMLKKELIRNGLKLKVKSKKVNFLIIK